MEQVHGVDVSWMTHGNPKDKPARANLRRRSPSQNLQSATLTGTSIVTSTTSNSNTSATTTNTTNTTNTIAAAAATTTGNPTTTPNNGAAARPSLTRTISDDKKAGPPSQRRGSWFSNISSKFSSGSLATQSPPQANTTSPKPAELSVPRANPAKNAVLPHASKHEGEGPYTPAPPRGSQASLLHVFRRLSSSNGNSTGPISKPHNHGLVERRVLNVDRHRERCAITGLHQSKLRRVAFRVDVEVAPMPKYVEEGARKNKIDKEQKKKAREKSEGDALKNANGAGAQKEQNGTTTITDEPLCAEPDQEVASEKSETVADKASLDSKAETKKKDKKKKSEEERKARKEKKRKLAEANGTIPMELHLDSGDESSSSATVGRPETPKPQIAPTTNPVRIYRRCCQLREAPILRKITEQLMDPANTSEDGMVDKLDLAGFTLQLVDLVTLGDYLAVVPVREVILENCGLTDEGLRVVLAGLLAARKFTYKKRKPHVAEVDDSENHGGVVERLVLKKNKLGPEGWRHICLFLYLCKSLKQLDVSGVQFPRPAVANGQQPVRPEQDLSRLLAKTLSERLGGSTMGLLNLGQTGLTTYQLCTIIDGVIQCGIRRLGLAHIDIDQTGLECVAKLIRSGVCEGLDLGGNALTDQLAVIADAIEADENCPLWALSLADCNLKPPSLCKLLPKLVKSQLRFLDLSHNHDLFSSSPSAVSVLRRYLPKMQTLKRIHLVDCSLNSEQVIALAEIIPEIPGLAHISFLENPEITELATNANTEETKEEACALYASLLAAARVSSSLVAVDIDLPSEQSSDLVKAMAKHVVAYCLRNMELAAVTATKAADVPEPQYPEALQRLVGNDSLKPSEVDYLEAAPDDDYVIGGTGLVKALACCLKNRGDESRRQSGEFIRDVENGVSPTRKRTGVPAGKAKETSKHMLSTARRIRNRLQPAIVKARSVDGGETHAYHRLIFLDTTLQGMISRFEQEFPDTREDDSAIALSSSLEDYAIDKHLSASLSSSEAHLPVRPASLSDPDDEADHDGESINEPSLEAPTRRPLARTGSALSLTSKALANEEGRVLRAGHQFRSAIVKPEHYALLSSRIEMVGADPNHVRLLHELIDEFGDEELRAQVLREKDVVKVFEENKGLIMRKMKEADEGHWDSFVESQVMARKNVGLGEGEEEEEEKGDVAVV